MCTKSKNTSGRFIPSSRVYEHAKLLMSIATKERLKTSNYWNGKRIYY